MLRILNDWTQNDRTQNDRTQNDRTQNDKDTDYDRIIAMINL